MHLLDNPSLHVFHIKLPLNTTGSMLVSFFHIVAGNCQLYNLTDLELGDSSWIHEQSNLNPSKITSQNLRKAPSLLLPLLQLKCLRINVASGFLDTSDLAIYQAIANRKPNLRTHYLDYANDWRRSSNYYMMITYENIPIHHLAAFCNMFPCLKEVAVGAVNGISWDESPKGEYICKNLEILIVGVWAGTDDLRAFGSLWGGEPAKKRVMKAAKTYFPGLTEDSSIKVGLYHQWAPCYGVS